MKKIFIIFTVCAVLAVPAAVMAFPSVYPTGTTIYKPKKCANGYTVYGTEVEGEGSVLINMNGKVVKQWKNMSNREHPVKILEGGYIMGATREKTEHVGRIWGHPESTDMSVMDWDGNIVWSFPKAGMHHDFQILNNPVGYWVPGMPLQVPKKGDKVLILSHKVVHSKKSKKISDKVLYDDYIAEVDYDGNIVWEYSCSFGPIACSHITPFVDMCVGMSFSIISPRRIIRLCSLSVKASASTNSCVFTYFGSNP